MAYVAAETLPPLIGPALRYLTIVTGVQASELSKLPSVLSAGSVAGGLVAGSIFDSSLVKLSAYRSCVVLCGALLAAAVANALVPESREHTSMYASTLVLGVFNGVFRAGANCVVLRLHGEMASPYMQALHLFGGFGRVLAPAILGRFVDDNSNTSAGLHLAYRLASCLSIFAVILLLPILCFTSPEMRSQSLANKSSTKHNKSSRKNGKHKQQVPRSGTASSSPLNLVLCGVLLLLFTGVQSTFQSFVSSYAIHAGFAPKDAVLVAGVFGTFFTVGRVIAIPLSTRVSSLNMMRLDAIGVSAALTISMLMPNSRDAVWLGTGLFGISVASLFPSTLNFAKQVLNASGQSITLIMQAASAGAIFIPLLMDVMGGDETMVKCLTALAGVAMGLLFVVLPVTLETQEKIKSA